MTLGRTWQFTSWQKIENYFFNFNYSFGHVYRETGRTMDPRRDYKYVYAILGWVVLIMFSLEIGLLYL